MPCQNYHRHSHVSNIYLADSVSTNEDYCKRAVELGQSIISSCEHGCQGRYFECASLAEKYGLKWRYVAEAYFVKDRLEKDNTNCHIILAAKTRKGVGDLNEALSEANISGYYYRPRVDLDLLMKLDPKDVFVTTACIAGVYRYGYEDAERLILQLRNHFSDSFMLEVQNHHTEKQREVNRFILGLYQKYGIPLIMGLDSHFIYPEESVLRDQRLEANHIVYEDESGWFLDYPSDDVAYQRFVDQGVLSEVQIREAMENTNVFLDFEDVVFDKAKKLPTLYPELSQEERNQKYRDLVYEKWDEQKKNIPEEQWPIYLDGIKYETDTIISTNTSDYFLMDYELVKRGKEYGGAFTLTGRGSAPSYYTNSLLGFSSIDRFALPVTMYPDRFISKDRILSGSLPDIDLNCGEVEPFIKAQSELMGEWKSAPMVAFGTLKRAAAWKMYCRAKSVPFDSANAVSGMLDKYEKDLKYADEDEKDEIDVLSYVPKEYHEDLKMSEGYMGIIDSIAPHPCAHLLCQKDIRREIGIFRINSKQKKEPVFAAFIDGETAERYGYLKNDILKVDVVKINADAYRRIGIPQPSAGELLKLTDHDKPTWDMYAKGFTVGLNQAEKEKATMKVMRYKPKNISELSAFVAAIRPAFQSMLNLFLERKHFDYGIQELDNLVQTKEMPSSFILYQEQMMKVLQYGSFTAPESYSAIKAIAKKHPEKVLPLKERFLNGFRERLLKEESVSDAVATDTANKVWEIISDACSYGFNGSHSVSVALDSLYGAYAKAHYPYEYYTALLSNSADKKNKKRIAKVKSEMRIAFGIRISPCRFRQDNRDFFIDKESHTISDALTSVKGISAKVANALYSMRDNLYPFFTDVLFDMSNMRAFNSASITSLITMGYFKEFGTSGKLLKLYDMFRDGKIRYSKSLIQSSQLDRLSKLEEYEGTLEESELPIEDVMKFEVEYYGTPLTEDQSCKGKYAVVEVDDKYSPKISLYNISNGNMGVMKVRKPDFKMNPMEAGDVIDILKWKKSPAYTYMNGKPTVKKGATDLWIEEYKILKSKSNTNAEVP